MTAPAPKPNSGPAAVLALQIFAGLWAFAAIILGTGLWQDSSEMDGDSSLALNAGAITVIVLCLLGTSLCAVGAVIVDQVAKRQTVEAERG